ncbi:Hypothetical protein POVN_LOCUS678 [uncultured virus]|nr:Hypothetical protein POVN_LOCUS678 [uncultured virus]
MNYLLVLVLCVVAEASLCAPAFNVTCPPPFNNADPGLTGNLAFPLLTHPKLLEKGREVNTFFASAGTGYEEIPQKNYHSSIYYFPCVSVSYTQAVKDALQSFHWHSFNIKLTDICCSVETQWPGFAWDVLLCVDPASEAAMTNFTARIITHLNAKIPGINIPDYLSSQPWHHVTLGAVPPTYDITGAFKAIAQGAVKQPSITMQVDMFYFGTTLYEADDFLKPGGTSNVLIIVLPIAGALLLVALCCLPCIRECLARTFLICMGSCLWLDDRCCNVCKANHAAVPTSADDAA